MGIGHPDRSSQRRQVGSWLNAIGLVLVLSSLAWWSLNSSQHQDPTATCGCTNIETLVLVSRTEPGSTGQGYDVYFNYMPTWGAMPDWQMYDYFRSDHALPAGALIPIHVEQGGDYYGIRQSTWKQYLKLNLKPSQLLVVGFLFALAGSLMLWSARKRPPAPASSTS